VSEIAYEDPVQGPALLAFDGRILELFTVRGASEGRLIVGMLHVDVGEPNRKGRREIMFSAGPGRRGGGVTVWVDEDAWPALEPLVREVEAAVAAAA
jgi:hypothetical protein